MKKSKYSNILVYDSYIISVKYNAGLEDGIRLQGLIRLWLALRESLSLVEFRSRRRAAHRHPRHPRNDHEHNSFSFHTQRSYADKTLITKTALISQSVIEVHFIQVCVCVLPFWMLLKESLCSPKLHLFDQKQKNKPSNIVKYYSSVNHLFSSTITPVFSVTWPSRNHSNMRIWWSTHTYDYYQSWTQLCNFMFQYSIES